MRNSKLIALLSAAALVISSLSGLAMGGNSALAAAGDASYGSSLGKLRGDEGMIIPLYVSERVIVSEATDKDTAAAKHLEDRKGGNWNGYYKIKTDPAKLWAGANEDGTYEIPNGAKGDLLVTGEGTYCVVKEIKDGKVVWEKLSKRLYDATKDNEDEAVEENGKQYVYFYTDKRGNSTYVKKDAIEGAAEAEELVEEQDNDEPAAGTVVLLKAAKQDWVSGYRR